MCRATRREQQDKCGVTKGRRQRRGRGRYPQAVARSVGLCVVFGRGGVNEEREGGVGGGPHASGLLASSKPSILLEHTPRTHTSTLTAQVIYAWCC